MSLKCPTCDREFFHQGGFNLHKYHCKYKNMDVSKVQMKEEKKECECEYRFLNSHDRSENLAIQNGYNEVCTKCQNLRV